LFDALATKLQWIGLTRNDADKHGENIFTQLPLESVGGIELFQTIVTIEKFIGELK
jgi:hypothetical protein